MQFLPIIERELRVGPRRPLFYRTRFMPPLMGIGVLLLFAWSVHTGAPTQMMGKQLFYMCFGGIFLGCLFAGVNWTADSISSEKREGTIGFLFLTDLKGYDVVLGKLVSSSISGVYSLIGILPVLSVVFLMGGVDWELMLKLVLASANVLFFSLSIGLLASVLCRLQKNARGLASGTIIMLSVIPPLAGGFLTGYLALPGQHPAVLACYSLSPGMAFLQAVMPAGRMLPGHLYLTLIATQITGWFALIAACRLVRNNWQEKSATKQGFNWRSRFELFSKGQKHAERRRRLLDINAIHWLTNQERGKGLGVWVLFGMIALTYLTLVVCYGKDVLNVSFLIMFVLVMNSALKFSLAGEACRWISQDRQNGALELTLTTSMTVADILEGQRKSLRTLYFKPFVAAVSLEVCLAIAALISGAISGREVMAMLGFLAISLAIIPADFLALGWVGMWKALSANPPTQARAETIRTILFTPVLLFYLSMIALAIFTLGVGAQLTPVLYPAAMIGISVWWMKRAKERLLAEFRQRATERYNPLPAHPWWTKAGRFFGRLISRK